MIIVGVDEVGRGCLVGNVVAGAVILPDDFILCVWQNHTQDNMRPILPSAYHDLPLQQLKLLKSPARKSAKSYMHKLPNNVNGH
jgi:hypothetical protein